MTDELTPKEKARLAQLEAQYEPELTSEEETRLAELETIYESPEMSASEAAKIGGLHGLSLHSSDELAGASQVVSEVIDGNIAAFGEQMVKGTEDALPSISETYAARRDQERALIEKAKKDQPWAYYSSDIAGMTATTAATFGTGWAIHGAKWASSLSGLITTGGAIAGAVEIGDSTKDTMAEVLKEGIEGAVVGGALEAATPVVGKKVLQYTKGQQAGALVKYLGDKFHTVKENVEAFGSDVVEWAGRTIEYTAPDGKPLVQSFISRADMLERFDNARKHVGAQLGDILKQTDDILPTHLNAQPIKQNILENVIDKLPSATGDQRKIIKQTRDFIEETFKEEVDRVYKTNPKTGEVLTEMNIKPIQNMSLERLHDIRNSIYAGAKGIRRSTNPNDLPLHEAKMKVASHIDTTIQDSLVRKSKFLDEDLLTAFRKSQVEYGDIKNGVTAIENRISKDNGKSFVQKLVNDRFFTFASVGGAVSHGMGLPVGNVMLTVAGLRAIGESKAVNAVLAKSATRMANVMTANPAKYNTIAGSIVVSAGISGEALIDNLTSASAAIELMETPMERTSEDLFKRKDALLTLLDKADPDIAKELRDAIGHKNYPKIGNMIGKLESSLPPGTLSPGTGFDGVAYTDQDKASVLEKVNKIKNTRKRMHLKSQFLKDSVIPQDILEGGDGQEPDKFFDFEKARKGPSNNKF